MQKIAGLGHKIWQQRRGSSRPKIESENAVLQSNDVSQIHIYQYNAVIYLMFVDNALLVGNKNSSPLTLEGKIR